MRRSIRACPPGVSGRIRRRLARRPAPVALLIAVLVIGCGDAEIGPLAAAAEAGDRPALVRLLAEGEEPNAVDGDGLTPLLRAVRRGHVRLISPLISRGADPDLPEAGSTGWTPLMHAIHLREVDVARALLNSGADPNASSVSGTTPLMPSSPCPVATRGSSDPGRTSKVK